MPPHRNVRGLRGARQGWTGKRDPRRSGRRTSRNTRHRRQIPRNARGWHHPVASRNFHQMGVLRRLARKRPKLTASDRVLWDWLCREGQPPGNLLTARTNPTLRPSASYGWLRIESGPLPGPPQPVVSRHLARMGFPIGTTFEWRRSGGNTSGSGMGRSRRMTRAAPPGRVFLTAERRQIRIPGRNLATKEEGSSERDMGSRVDAGATLA